MLGVQAPCDDLHGCPASILVGEERHGYMLYPLQETALSVGYTPIDGLETEVCRYLLKLWGLGCSRSFLRGAVSAMRALEEMGWLPEFVTGRVWRCAKWSTSGPVARPYA